MPKTSKSNKKSRSRRSLGASKIRIKYPDMNTWRILHREGYPDDEIDAMNPFEINFPARDASDEIHSVRIGAGKILKNPNLYTRHHGRYRLDSEEFYLVNREPIEKLLRNRGFEIASGDNSGEEWIRPQLAETSRRIVF